MSADRLEVVTDENWQEFVAAPLSVLSFSLTYCPHCTRWVQEIEGFLAFQTDWKHVRFGNITLDGTGVEKFKEANPWLHDVEDVPFNVIFSRGERVSSFAGSSIKRLLKRLEQIPTRRI